MEYVGVGRVVSFGGVRGAVGRRAGNLRKEVDEGRFCEILCIVDDQYVFHTSDSRIEADEQFVGDGLKTSFTKLSTASAGTPTRSGSEPSWPVSTTYTDHR